MPESGKQKAVRNYKREYAMAKARLDAEAERDRVRLAQQKRRLNADARAREKAARQRKRANNPEYAKAANEALRQWRQSRYDEARGVVAEWKMRGCVICGERDPCCIDAHHIDPSAKSVAIGMLVNMGKKKEVIVGELSKCVQICSNCHRKLHAGTLSDECFTAYGSACLHARCDSVIS